MTSQTAQQIRQTWTESAKLPSCWILCPGYHLQLDSKNDYKLPKSHEIQTVENNGILIERLVKPVDGKKLRYVTYSNLFEVLLSHHQNCGHGKRNILYEEIKNLYANITKNHCKALVDCCDQC